MKIFNLKFLFILGIVTILSFLFRFIAIRDRESDEIAETDQISNVDSLSDSEFHYRFQTNGVLEETGLIADSSSSYWWLNSGGQMILKDGIGRTIQEEDSFPNSWRRAYEKANPIDTEEGSHPQNIFRLLTRKKWDNGIQEVRFRITNIRMSDSPNRDESNGVLLLSRYQNSDNLYYSGVRVDGHAVIKKKVNGVYQTLAETPVFFSESSYDKDTNPNLLPGKSWIRIRSRIATIGGEVRITLYIDKEDDGTWQEVLTARDTGGNSSPIFKEGLSGIRTDFLDAEFDDYKISRIL